MREIKVETTQQTNLHELVTAELTVGELIAIRAVFGPLKRIDVKQAVERYYGAELGAQVGGSSVINSLCKNAKAALSRRFINEGEGE